MLVSPRPGVGQTPSKWPCHGLYMWGGPNFFGPDALCMIYLWLKNGHMNKHKYSLSPTCGYLTGIGPPRRPMVFRFLLRGLPTQDVLRFSQSTLALYKGDRFHPLMGQKSGEPLGMYKVPL